MLCECHWRDGRRGRQPALGKGMSFRSPSACPLLTGPAVEVLGIDIPLDSLGFQLNSDLSFFPRAAAKISDGSQYYVLLIITDGVISDMIQTKGGHCPV